MSVFLSTVLYVVASLLYWLAFSIELLGDFTRKFEIEITVEFLIIASALAFRGYWGALVLIVPVCVIIYLEVGRRGAIGLDVLGDGHALGH